MTKKGKKAKAGKPSQRLFEIVDALEQNETGMTTGEIANVLGIQPGSARDILSAEVKRGNLRRVEVEDDGATVFKFFNVEGTPKSDERAGLNDDLMEEADDKATAEQVDGAPVKLGKEAKRGRKQRAKSPNSGRGNPEAKKSINPQQTLEDKKEIAKDLGGTMTWAGRQWHVKGPNIDYSFTSRELAGFTLEAFRKKLEG